MRKGFGDSSPIRRVAQWTHLEAVFALKKPAVCSHIVLVKNSIAVRTLKCLFFIFWIIVSVGEDGPAGR